MGQLRIRRYARTRIGIAAIPFFGKADCKNLMSEIAEILAVDNPQLRVECVHIEHAPDLALPQIRVAIIVDDDLQSGLFLTPGKNPEGDHVT